jgi:glc operon protein GlcG
MTITLSEANRAISAALAKADDLAIRVSVTVCDPCGHLIAHQRMDGVFAEASRGSIGKAIAAAEGGRPSGAEPFEPEHLASIVVVTGAAAPIIRRRGGLPIVQNGTLEGAVGVSGAPGNQQDEECALAALAAMRKST